MGKLPYIITSESTDDDASRSAENTKKPKKILSILKCRESSKKNKRMVNGRSEVDEHSTEFSERMKKLRGILKHSSRASSDEEDRPRPKGRYLVGRVPRSAISGSGCSGGVSIVIRRSSALEREQAQRINIARRRHLERLT